VQVDGIDDAVDVVAGEGFSCALHDDQTVSCWGLNEVGQLGDASFVDSSLPVKVVGLGDAIDIAAGETNACAISEAEGQVVCWGGDDEGQLGNGGDNEPSNEPVDVELFAIVTIVPFDGAANVECGWRSCCAVRDNATAGCWGRNAQGGLAGGSTADGSNLALVALDEIQPARVLENVADVGVAANFTCFALDDNSVWCAGEVPALQVDYPGSPDLPHFAVELDLFADAVEIWGGTGHACSLRTSGRVLCWGNNGEYQAGDPDGGFSDGYQLPDLQDPIDFAAGERFNCFVDTEGKVSCFGNNEFRQLGVDTTEDAVAEAQRVIF
jgi:alpha-tubulin suppressor-like RCC1 family protein